MGGSSVVRMNEGGGLPEGLAEMPPGPGLSALLATVDPASLPGSRLVDLLCARNRQVSWEQAQLLTVVRELAYAPLAGTDGEAATRSPGRDVHASKEIAFALGWTGHAAGAMVCLAVDAIEKLPAVHAALSAGQLDLPRARVICHELADLPADAARVVLAHLLDGGPMSATTGQLRERIRRLVLQVDPEAAKKRHERDLTKRRVERDTHANGTATLFGVNLPKDKTAAAWDNLHRIAAATKAAGGETRTLDQIRADVYLDLLAGVDPTLAGAVTPAPRRGVVNLHVELATLMCLADHAGQIDGFGPVVADIARQVAAAQRDIATFRFSVSHDGRLLYEGRLRYRPTADQIAHVKARDKTCRAPGCRRPAMRCEVDHIRAWEHNGVTEEWNLCTLCKGHHDAKHQGGYGLTRTDLGVAWTTPRGRTYHVSFGRDLNATERRLLQDVVNHTSNTRLRR